MSKFKIGDKVVRNDTERQGGDYSTTNKNAGVMEVVSIEQNTIYIEVKIINGRQYQVESKYFNLETEKLINKETMKDITEFGKKALSDAKKEIAIERAELEKEQAKKILREIYAKKDVAEEVIKTTTKDLEKIDESLKVFNQK